MYKVYRSDDFNYNFDSITGYTEMWGKTQDDDPIMAPFPVIADIEIATTCHGLGAPCKFCYKSNTPVGKYMAYDTFVGIFDKLPKELTQIAFGIGDMDSNPDLYKIMLHCRCHDVIPNITINGARLTQEDCDALKLLCGAVAVSHYDDDVCFNAVERLTHDPMDGQTLKQVNIHQLLAKETVDDCLKLIEQVHVDPRLVKLNAIVFLLLKPKGARNTMHSINDLDVYVKLFKHAMRYNVNIGFDSCSANNFIKALKRLNKDEYLKYCEACESTLFSIYINVDGDVYPCSFCEGVGVWKKGISLATLSFNDVWNSSALNDFRTLLCQNHRNCPMYDLKVD